MSETVSKESGIAPTSSALHLQSDSDCTQRRLPVGAEVLSGGRAHFRVWAPRATSVAVNFDGKRPEAVLRAESDGYFSGIVTEVPPGTLYRYRLGSGRFPDPASRFQPEGPHGPSAVIDPTDFRWTDPAWGGVASGRQGLSD